MNSIFIDKFFFLVFSDKKFFSNQIIFIDALTAAKIDILVDSRLDPNSDFQEKVDDDAGKARSKFILLIFLNYRFFQFLSFVTGLTMQIYFEIMFSDLEN